MTGPPESILSVSDLVVTFPARHGDRVHAVRRAGFDLLRGETLALVGESGSGKSTVARAVLRLLRPDRGHVVLRDRRSEVDLVPLAGGELRRHRRRIQMVFQDSQASLDPRFPAWASVAEPLLAFGLARSRADAQDHAARLFEQVGLDRSLLGRFPHELSGGQRQRVGIARALAATPEILVLDEAVSALDVSLRAQVVNLLLALRRERELSMLFISHDLAVVRVLADRVLVMYAGEIVEHAASGDLFREPLHPYTRTLLAAVPVPDPVVQRARGFSPPVGEPPSPENLPAGCAFAPRCPLAEARCRTENPGLREMTPGRSVACHYVGP